LTQSTLNSLEQDEIDGELRLPGVVADVVAKKGQFASIYGWTGDKTGRTRAALRALKEYGKTVVVHDPGDSGTPSRAYWNKMQAEGLVDEMQDADGLTIRLVTPEQHHDDLVNSFIFAARAEEGSTDDARRVAKLNLAYSRRQCELAMEQGVGCGKYPGSVLVQFLCRQDWARQESGRQLWAQYVECGLIDPNEMVSFQDAVVVDVGSSGLLHPLEAAVINGNLDSLRALMESGADESAVPTRDWSLSQNTRSKEGSVIEEIHGFIWAKTPNPVLGPLMSAIVTEASMNRSINAGQAAPAEAPQPRRARRAL
jgi:hypothetical protein